MKKKITRAAASQPFSDGYLPSENGGRRNRPKRERRPVSSSGGTAPTPRSVSAEAAQCAKTERSGVLAREQEHGESHATGARPAYVPLVGAWADKHRYALAEREQQARRAAERTGKPWSLHADEQTRAILADSPARTVTEKTANEYRKVYERLRASGQTALEAANTRAHWDKLRTACRYCLAEDARAWRAASERARKRGDLASAQRRTLRAWQLVTVLDIQFLQPDRATWAVKAAKLKAAGQPIKSKSKRRGAPPPDSLLLTLLTTGRRGTVLADRHGERMAMAALFSMRPAEAIKGVRLAVEGKGGDRLLTAQIVGAKVDGKRGQSLRLAGVPVKGAAAELLAARVEAEGGRWVLETTPADHRSLNRALQPLGLSWYSLRHQIGSELKEAVSTGALQPEEAAAFMGHRSSKSLSYYGSRSKARGGRVFRGKAVEPVRVMAVTQSQKAEARAGKKAGKSLGAGTGMAPKSKRGTQPDGRAPEPQTSHRAPSPGVPKAPKPPRW